MSDLSRGDAAATDAPPPPAAAIAVPDARHVSAYSTREKVARMLWAVVQATAFRLSFHNWYGFRVWLLRRFGARVGADVRIRRTVVVECPWNLAIGDGSSIGHAAIVYCLGPVTIGRRVSISQYAHVCAGSHDYRRADMPLTRPPVTIGDDAWIAADAFVGPNVTVGEGAILAARGVALRDLESWTIYLGNPAQSVRSRPRFGAPT